MTTLVLTLLACLLLVYIYHLLCQQRERRQYPPPGDLISVDNENMHILRKGKGKPTVVFSCGAISFSLGMFYKSFHHLADITRTILYDRYGYGWSDLTSKPRTMEQLARDLHHMLHNSQESPPFVLVGHSLGAVEVFTYAMQYPDEVAGLVLLDPAYLDERSAVSMPLVARVMGLLRRVGILRLLIKAKLFNVYQGIDAANLYQPETIRLTEMILYNRGFNANNLSEMRHLLASFRQVEPIGDIPLLVLTAENPKLREREPKVYQDLLAHHQWLTSLSTNSKHKVLPNTDHSFPIAHPDLVTSEVTWFIDNMVKPD